MFKAIGVVVALYAVYAAITGKVYAKAGTTGRTVSREDSPEYFWIVIAVYFGLSLALLLVF